MVVAELLTKLGFKVDLKELDKGVRAAEQAVKRLRDVALDSQFSQTFNKAGGAVKSLANDLREAGKEMRELRNDARGFSRQSFSPRIKTPGSSEGSSALGGIAGSILGGPAAALGQMGIGALRSMGSAMVGTMGHIASSAGESAVQFEAMETRLSTMLKSGDKAKSMFGDITKYAAETSYYTKDVMGGAVTLLNSMVSQGEVMPLLKQIGDIAGNSGQFERLAQALGRVSSRTYMSGRELNRFEYGGNFGILQQRAQMEAVDAGMMTKGQEVKSGTELDAWIKTRVRDLREMVSAKGFTADMVRETIAYATSAGGLYFQHQEEQRKTFSGHWSTMVDSINITIGQALRKLFPIANKIMDVFINMDLSWLPGVFEKLGGAIEYVWSVMVGAGLLDAWERFKQAAKDLFGTIGNYLSGGGLMMMARHFAVNVISLLDLASALLKVVQFLVWLEDKLRIVTTVVTIFDGVVKILNMSLEGWLLLFDAVQNGVDYLSTKLSELSAWMGFHDWLDGAASKLGVVYDYLSKIPWKALAGIILGGAAGTAVGGPLGTAIGGVLGGIWGYSMENKGGDGIQSLGTFQQSYAKRADASQTAEQRRIEQLQQENNDLTKKIAENTGTMARNSGFSEQRLLDLALRPNFARKLALAEYE